jgi:hypothetical protein
MLTSGEHGGPVPAHVTVGSNLASARGLVEIYDQIRRQRSLNYQDVHCSIVVGKDPMANEIALHWSVRRTPAPTCRHVLIVVTAGWPKVLCRPIEITAICGRTAWASA